MRRCVCIFTQSKCESTALILVTVCDGNAFQPSRPSLTLNLGFVSISLPFRQVWSRVFSRQPERQGFAEGAFGIVAGGGRAALVSLEGNQPVCWPFNFKHFPLSMLGSEGDRLVPAAWDKGVCGHVSLCWEMVQVVLLSQTALAGWRRQVSLCCHAYCIHSAGTGFEYQSKLLQVYFRLANMLLPGLFQQCTSLCHSISTAWVLRRTFDNSLFCQAEVLLLQARASCFPSIW